MSSLAALLLLGASDPVPANWPGFRGDGTNRSSLTDLPLTWSPRENVAWRESLPGYGQSSPVVWGKTVFLTAVDGKEKERCIVLAADVTSGKRLWAKNFPASQKGKNNPSMSRAAPTPVVDSKHVYAFFETGDLLALGHDGMVKWQRSLTTEFGAFKNHHGLGSSLAQTKCAVIVLVDHGGKSYLLAVDKATGKTHWKADRKSGLSWTSPVVTERGGRELVLVSSNGTLTGYDARDGSELCSLGGLTGNLIPSPAVEGDVVVVGAGENGLTFDMKAAAKSNCCVRLRTADGKFAFEKLWEGKRAVLQHASPVVLSGHVYFLTKSGILHCHDLKTGEERYSERLDSPCWATPVAVGDRLYCFGKDGVTTVVSAGSVFEKLATNRLWGRDEHSARTEKAKTNPENQFPPLPTQGREQMEAMLRDAVGDVVYGVAVTPRAFLVRTGTELICVRRPD
jgi:outer membrane protein assembly factor BamB